MISVNMGEAPGTVKTYVTSHALSFVNLLDQQYQVSSMFAVRATPTNYVINRWGCILAGGPGYRDWTTPAAHALIISLLTEAQPRQC